METLIQKKTKEVLFKKYEIVYRGLSKLIEFFGIYGLLRLHWIDKKQRLVKNMVHHKKKMSIKISNEIINCVVMKKLDFDNSDMPRL